MTRSPDPAERERIARLLSPMLGGVVAVLGILVTFRQWDAEEDRVVAILATTLLTGLLTRSSIAIQQMSLEEGRRPTKSDRRAVLVRNLPYLLVGVVPIPLLSLAVLGFLPLGIALLVARWTLVAYLFAVGAWMSRLMGNGPGVVLLDGLRLSFGGIGLVLLGQLWR